MLKGIEACKPDQKSELHLHGNENDHTKLSQTDSKSLRLDQYNTMTLGYILASVIATTLLLTGIGLIVHFYKAGKSQSSHSRSNQGVTIQPDTKISKALCPNGNVEDCPDHLKLLLVALEVCSAVDEEDLTQRLMRRDVDLAILRETVLNNPGRNASSTDNKGSNAIM